MINTSTSDENLCGLKRADFQTTVNGKQTDLFILKNENGAEIAVTNYGGAVLAIMVPDKNGKYANVIQGHDSITHVINSHEPFLSTLIGRYGNRIAGGKFILEGKEYSLTINNGPNRTIEVNILHFHSDIYDKFIRLTFVKRTRPELKYDSIDQLIAQLHKDAEETETILFVELGD